MRYLTVKEVLQLHNRIMQHVSGMTAVLNIGALEWLYSSLE